MSIAVEFKGYANRPATKTSANGRAFNVYTVRARTDKNKDGTYNHAYVSCKDYGGGALPPDGAFVTVRGSLSVHEYEKDGKARYSLDVFVNSLEVAPSRDGAARTPSAGGDVPEWMNEV